MSDAFRLWMHASGSTLYSMVLLLTLFTVPLSGCKDSAVETASDADRPGERPTTSSDRVDRPIAFRIQFEFSDGRTARAGIAFIPSARPDIAITSSHLALGLKKLDRVRQFELTDCDATDVRARATSLARPAGPMFEGFDYSKDFVFVQLEAPVSTDRTVQLADGPASVGDEVQIVVCGAAEVAETIRAGGRVVHVSPERIEVEIDAGLNTRGFTGAPIIDSRSGEAIGFVQNVLGRAGKRVVLATPMTGIHSELGSLDSRETQVPLASW